MVTSEEVESKHSPRLFVPELYRRIKALSHFAKNSLVAMAASAVHPVFTGNTLNAFILLGAIGPSC